MKNIIRKWLGLAYVDETRPETIVRDVLDGAEMALVAYRIDNGYMLRVSGRGNNTMIVGNGVRLIYCTDEKDMAEKIVAHRAFTKLAGTEYAQKSNKF